MASGLNSTAPYAAFTGAYLGFGDQQHGLYAVYSPPLHAWVAHELAQVMPILWAVHAYAEQNPQHVVVGGVSYEAAPAFDAAFHDVVDLADGHSSWPLLVFQAFDKAHIELIHEDTAQNTIADTTFPKPVKVHAHSQTTGNASAVFHAPWLVGATANALQNSMSLLQEQIAAGDMLQVNLTTPLQSQWPWTNHGPVCPWAYFKSLYAQQPAQYSLFLQGEFGAILSFSPELFFKTERGLVTTQPMKGTQAKGTIGVLSDNPKERAENVMIVDLLRNDLSKICQPRTVRVQELFRLIELPSVSQMVSTITGLLRPQHHWVHVLQALFPCGSVTGAPKRQAMKSIKQHEHQPRGLYCGALGVLSVRENNTGQGCNAKDVHAVFNVPIRTVVRCPANTTQFGVGSGITWAAKPADELKEWWHKTQFLRNATCNMQLLETLLLKHGQWVRLNLHLARMRAAANHFGYAWDEPAIVALLGKASKTNAQGQQRVRLLSSAEGVPSLEIHPIEPSVDLSHEGISLDLANTGIETAIKQVQPWLGVNDEHEHNHVLMSYAPFLQYKTTYRPMYTWFDAQKTQNAWDVLLHTNKGVLTETCKANIALKIAGTWYTPPAMVDNTPVLLPGVLRGELLHKSALIPQKLCIRDITRADAMCVFNSLRGCMPVRMVNMLQFEHVFDCLDTPTMPLD